MDQQIAVPAVVTAAEPRPAPASRITAPVAIPRCDHTDVPLYATLGLGAAITVLVVVFLQGAGEGYLPRLILERGLTQYASLLLAACSLAFVTIKAVRLVRLASQVRAARDERPVPSTDAPSERLLQLRDAWRTRGNAALSRRARVLQAALVSGRVGAVGQAEDDAATAQAMMDQSFGLPKTLIWAIPLMGFIGTVVGISSAVTGFSGFLQSAEEIEQIKEGIGAVTTGLAVAFDTTLFALALSVVAMLPLALLERVESKLLLELEADTADAVLSRIAGEGTATAVADPVDAETVRRAVHQAVREVLPEPAQLTSDVRMLMEATARSIAQSLEQSAARIQQAQRESITTTLSAVAQARDAHATLTTALAAELRQITAALASRVEALNGITAQVGEVQALASALNHTLDTLERTSALKETLSGVSGSLRDLKPSLDRLAQPRRILLVEAENGHG
jgi:biopolymer transport protein ExbB/TolQ